MVHLVIFEEKYCKYRLLSEIDVLEKTFIIENIYI